MRRYAAWIFLLVSAAFLPATPAKAEVSEAARAQRWADLRHVLFGDRAVEEGGDLVRLAAPDRAADAALVPVTISLAETLAPEVRQVYLVIDENPSPLAAVFHAGSAADLREIGTRVRVDDYTYMHAVAETADGKLYGTTRFIKAAGGCSAPAGKDQALAMERLGRMKLSFQGKPRLNETVTAQLLVSHPNNSGMQMDQLTRNYIPADFVRTIRIAYAGAPILTIDGDISLSEDPTIRFTFVPKRAGELSAEIEDSSDRRFTASWPLADETQM